MNTSNDQEECERVVLETLYGFLSIVSSQKDPIRKRKLKKEYLSFMNKIVRQTLESSLDNTPLRSASGNMIINNSNFRDTHNISTPLSEKYIKQILFIRNRFEKI